MEGPIDLPERQRTLRAAIDWSYQRLTATQRELHGALAVFADGGSLDDARAIAEAGREFLSDLEALVGWSLVRSEATDGEVRLSMLETVREHALDRLRARTAASTSCGGAMPSASSTSRWKRGHRAPGSRAGHLARSLEREFDNHRRRDSTGCSRQVASRMRSEPSFRSSASGAATPT